MLEVYGFLQLTLIFQYNFLEKYLKRKFKRYYDVFYAYEVFLLPYTSHCDILNEIFMNGCLIILRLQYTLH